MGENYIMNTNIGMDMKKNGFTLSVEKYDTSQFCAYSWKTLKYLPDKNLAQTYSHSSNVKECSINLLAATSANVAFDMSHLFLFSISLLVSKVRVSETKCVYI